MMLYWADWGTDWRLHPCMMDFQACRYLVEVILSPHQEISRRPKAPPRVEAPLDEELKEWQKQLLKLNYEA